MDLVHRNVEEELKPELELAVQETQQIVLQEQFLLKKDPVTRSAVL